MSVDIDGTVHETVSGSFEECLDEIEHSLWRGFRRATSAKSSSSGAICLDRHITEKEYSLS
ncbi:SRSO17 transposase [Catenulispora sp. GP43]